MMSTLTANPSLISANRQVLLLLQSYFSSKPEQAKPFTCSVREKYEGIAYQLEVNPNTNGSFLVYRMKFKDGTQGLWQSWDEPSEVENSFRMWSLI